MAMPVVSYFHVAHGSNLMKFVALIEANQEVTRCVEIGYKRCTASLRWVTCNVALVVEALEASELLLIELGEVL